MIVTLTPAESLTVVADATATTTDPTYLASWSDEGSPDQQAGSLNGATAVEVAAAPGNGIRSIRSLMVYNADTVSAVITISKVVDGSSITIAKVTLLAGYTLIMNESGISVISDSGERSQSSGSGANVVGAAAGTGVVATETDLGGGWNKTLLTLTDTPIVMADEAGTIAYGGLKIYDMPRGRIAVLSASVSLALAKTSAGIDDAFDSDFALGTAAASNNATLTSTEANLIASGAVTQASSGETAHSADSTAMLAIDGAATPMDVYANLLVDDDDHDVTSTPANVELTGTVELIWKYLGP